jgi:hypothetical protein
VAKALTRIGKAKASGVPTVALYSTEYQSRNVHPSKRRGKANVVVPMSDNGRCQCEAKLCVGKKKKKENDQNPLIGPLRPYLPTPTRNDI